MRTFLPLLAVVCFAGVPVTTVSAAEAVTAAATVPAANANVLATCHALVEKLASASKTAVDSAKAASAIPFAGAAAKGALEKATATAADADSLSADLKNLLAGKAASSEGVLAKVAAGKFNVAEHFKKLPGADTLQQILGTPGVAAALINQAPVDKLPGWSQISALVNANAIK